MQSIKLLPKPRTAPLVELRVQINLRTAFLIGAIPTIALIIAHYV